MWSSQLLRVCVIISCKPNPVNLLTSIDADGTEEGYDLELNKLICRKLSIPVIASGGCGKPIHMLEVFQKTKVDAALAASIFHYKKSTIKSVKQFLKRNNIYVRI